MTLFHYTGISNHLRAQKLVREHGRLKNSRVKFSCLPRERKIPLNNRKVQKIEGVVLLKETDLNYMKHFLKIYQCSPTLDHYQWHCSAIHYAWQYASYAIASRKHQYVVKNVEINRSRLGKQWNKQLMISYYWFKLLWRWKINILKVWNRKNS